MLLSKLLVRFALHCMAAANDEACLYRERTRTETAAADFQAIVISLKDYFFSKADALVGVTKTPGTGCSTTFTLDLTQYPESAN